MRLEGKEKVGEMSSKAENYSVKLPVSKLWKGSMIKKRRCVDGCFGKVKSRRAVAPDRLVAWSSVTECEEASNSCCRGKTSD